MVVIKVLINKVKRPTYWYKDLINKEVEVAKGVINIDGIENYLYADVSEIRWILKEDCTPCVGESYNK